MEAIEDTERNMLYRKIDEKDQMIGAQQSTINHLQERVVRLEEDRSMLTMIEDVVDELMIGARIDIDVKAIKSMKRVENIICELHNSSIDRVHIRSRLDDVTVLVTYPAYTIGNKSAIETAIIALHRRAR